MPNLAELTYKWVYHKSWCTTVPCRMAKLVVYGSINKLKQFLLMALAHEAIVCDIERK